MNSRARAAALIALLLAACGQPQQGTDWRRPSDANWPLASGDWGNTRYSTLTQITRENVRELRGAWTVDLGPGKVSGGPLVWDGLMFVHAGVNVRAVDPASGQEAWLTKLDSGHQTKGIALGEGLVFAGLSDASVVALEQKTGKIAWKSFVGEKVPDGTPATGFQWVGGAPSYANGIVIVGLSGARAPAARNDGRVVGLDAKTGNVAWTFHVIPAPGEPGHETWPADTDAWKKGGGAVWITPAVDPDLGLVYLGTGNAIPELGGQERAGDNLYTASLVALDLKTGKLAWHRQLTRHDIWEHDLGTSPLLYEANVGGRTVKAVAIMRTDGFLFTIDRASGKPVFAIEERPVPQNAEQRTAATQPYPVGVAQIAPDCVAADAVPPGFKLGCTFDVMTAGVPNLLTPLVTARSSPMSYSPKTGQFYVAHTIFPVWLRVWEDPYIFSSVHSIPFVKSAGRLTAIEGRTGKIAWQRDVPFRIENGSGVTATASGLLFTAMPDGNVEGYDAASGERLWRFQTGADVGGTITSYEVAGTQHLAVVSGTTLWAFKLGGTLPPREAPEPPPAESGIAGKVTPTNEIVISGTFEDPRNAERLRTYYDEFAFVPQRVRATVGKPVTWANKGHESHDATAFDGSWSTGAIAPGATKSVTLGKAGRYIYICKQHPWSYAEIIVEAD